MLRPALLTGLICAVCLVPRPAHAQQPIPASAPIEETEHTMVVALTREGATTSVTRTLRNPTPLPSRVDLPITLACEAQLDALQVVERGPDGVERWRTAELLVASEAEQRFDDYLAATADPSRAHAADGDTAWLLDRAGWSCDAELRVAVVPAGRDRRFGYRVFVPSDYRQGRYVIELPAATGVGLTPTVTLAAPSDPSLAVLVDGQPVTGSVPLDPDRAHTVELRPRDPGHGEVRAADLELAPLLGALPAARAQTEPAPERLQMAEFDAPARLTALPPVRRVVVVIDGSRSLAEHRRQRSQELAGAYLAALADAHADAEVEIVVFDRQAARVYHDFVPARWGAADLAKLEIAGHNGSELADALGLARALLRDAAEADPDPRGADRGADWIVVLSDLTLRSDFDLVAARAAAEASAVRIHVIGLADGEGLAPAAADAPWTALARATGGMAWASDGTGTDLVDELVEPRRIWDLSVELELADGTRRTRALERRLLAGERRTWTDHAADGPAITRVAVVGEVWGQRRAWLATPSPSVGRRYAGALANAEQLDGLSEAIATALAVHAGVVSPYTSAFALAHFAGTAIAPWTGSMRGWSSGHFYGSSIGCGGVRSHRGVGPSSPRGFASVGQAILDQCPDAGAGEWRFETTELEIVAVTSVDACVREATWAYDIAPTDAHGRKQVRLRYANGQITQTFVDPA